MKKILTIITLVAMIMVVGCVDLDDILRRLDAQERELATMKSLVDAMDKKISVQSYKELADKSGYELTMSDGSKITLKHGAKGEQGEKGEQGNPGQDGDANLTITEESGVVIIVYKGILYTLPKYVIKMTFTTSKAIGEKVKLQIFSEGTDPADIWIDLNNNGVKDDGEALTEFYSDIEYTLGSQTVTIYGKVNKLSCRNNQLTSLDVSQNTALEELDCFYNQLTSLDLSQNTALEWLDCATNQLTSLDVSNNTKLYHLDCFHNQLTSLDVSQNTALLWFTCPDNQLTSLDLSNNTKLQVFDCSYNQLTSLDLSKNAELESLHCYHNQLTSLDVSNNTELESLNCYDNKISGGNMTALVNSLPDRTGKKAGDFRVIAVGSGDEQNTINATQVAKAKSKNWSVLDYKDNPYTP